MHTKPEDMPRVTILEGEDPVRVEVSAFGKSTVIEIAGQDFKADPNEALRCAVQIAKDRLRFD